MLCIYFSISNIYCVGSWGNGVNIYVESMCFIDNSDIHSYNTRSKEEKHSAYRMGKLMHYTFRFVVMPLAY